MRQVNPLRRLDTIFCDFLWSSFLLMLPRFCYRISFPKHVPSITIPCGYDSNLCDAAILIIFVTTWFSVIRIPLPHYLPRSSTLAYSLGTTSSGFSLITGSTSPDIYGLEALCLLQERPTSLNSGYGIVGSICYGILGNEKDLSICIHGNLVRTCISIF